MPNIGRCIGIPSRTCGALVNADDLEWVRTPQGIIGGCCLDALLNPPIRERVQKPAEEPEVKVRDFQRRPSKVEREI